MQTTLGTRDAVNGAALMRGLDVQLDADEFAGVVVGRPSWSRGSDDPAPAPRHRGADDGHDRGNGSGDEEHMTVGPEQDAGSSCDR